MAESNDQRWLDILAGRPSRGAASADAREAEALRAAILATRDESTASNHDIESGVRKLLFRLRREGLDGAVQKRKSWQLYGAFALAATLVLAVGVVILQPQPVDDTPVYRGGGAQIVTAPDTERFAATLTAELEALGIKPKVTRFGTTFTITAEWPAKPDAKHTAFLKSHALKQPASGALVIELSQANSKK